MDLNELEVTDVLVEKEDCTVHLFDRSTVRIENRGQDIFLDVEAVDGIGDVGFSTLTELDRRILGKILARKNERYAELAKRLRKDAHSGGYIQTIQTSLDDPSPREVLDQLDKITDQAIQDLEQYVENTGWPTDLQK